MAGKKRMEIFTNTYEDATVKKSTVRCWVKYGRWPKQRNIKAKAGCMADHKCSHIVCSTFKCASTKSSISTNILHTLMNIPNILPPLPLKTL